MTEVDTSATAGGETARKRLVVVLWHRKWILLGTFVALTVLAGVISKSLPKEYEATATLWVTEGSGTATFDAVQAGQVLAGTYGRVADNRLLADRVAEELPFESSGGDLLNAMLFEPISETQLLEITATSRNAEHARVIANTYARVFIDYSQTNLGDAVNARIAFAAPASVPGQPARPQPTLYTLAGALLGLALGVGLAFLADALDQRVRSSRELEGLAGGPILARVPRRTNDPETTVAFEETFRLLRTNLQFLRGGDQLRSLVVVSPSASDGKSTVAYQLARSFAETDTSVILVEADMRRPSLRRTVLPSRGRGDQTKGLSNYLSRKEGLDAVLCATDLRQLKFVPAGVLPPAPSTLMNIQAARVLLEDALERADLVIVDTPPLSVGAEANILAASADGALMVIDPKVSKKSAVRHAGRQLSVVKATLLGVVLNSVRSLPDIGPYAYSYRINEDPPAAKNGIRSVRRRARSRE
jgi:receptor protein-tyrosine kinase